MILAMKSKVARDTYTAVLCPFGYFIISQGTKQLHKGFYQSDPLDLLWKALDASYSTCDRSLHLQGSAIWHREKM